MDCRIGRILALALAAVGWLAGPALAENRIALVIGNSSYETVSVLPNPANDAKAMSALLAAAGFEIVDAPNLGAAEMRRALREFAGQVAQKGPDTVALVFYAGHGLQVDGENFLVPVDARIAREADVPMETVRLADVMNALASTPSRTRIVILDACRNNPFAEIKATTGRGLAIVDAPTGSIVSYATAPGMEALDGAGDNSPFTAALVEVAREPGLPIEQALKRVRLKVHQTTNGQQTPWESSSLTGDFAFFAGAAGLVASAAPATAPTTRQIEVIEAGRAQPVSAAQSTAIGSARAQATKSVAAWRAELQPLPPQEAYELVIREDVVEAYEAFVAIYGTTPMTGPMRALFERRREMLAWYTAVTLNSITSYRSFLDRFPNSDLAATARRLMDRARTRSALASANALATPVSDAPPPAPPAPPPERVAAVPPAVACPEPPPRAAPPPTRVFVPPPKKKKEPPPKKHVKRSDPPPKRGGRAPTDADIFGPGRGPAAAPAQIPVQIGIGFGGGIRRGGGHQGGGHRPPQHYPPSHGGGGRPLVGR